MNRSTIVFSAPVRQRSRTWLVHGLGAAALFAAAAVSAQMPPAATGISIDASGSTESERAACMRGATQQDQATCLKEANNAAADKRNNRLEAPTKNMEANRFERCKVMTSDEDRIACEARMSGHGTTSGSVSGGGVLRGVETIKLPANGVPVRIAPTTTDPVILVPR